jgi:probable HAF family extracellular repeat protein
MTDLGAPPGWEGFRAAAINNRGEVVGYAFLPGQSQAFLWKHGTFVALETPPGTTTSATGINNRGQIVGVVAGGTYPTTSFVHAALWQPDGTFVDLGPEGTYGSEGGTFGRPYAINDRQQIVGEAVTPEFAGFGGWTAVLWTKHHSNARAFHASADTETRSGSQ